VHIVGDGPQRTALSALIKNLGISDHVILHGNVDRMILSVLYAKANCFVLPSRSEGWTLSIIEAMASRVPVIMTDVGFAGEVIKHEKNGLVVPVDGEKALTQALELLMSNVALRKRLSESAYAYFENYWTSDRILAGYKESWHNALIHK
jgi:glycosyltransferase involved in cell wall biosynthesis